jgi:hypothetical protein
MKKNIDFSKLSNAEINLKMMSYDNEYKAKKNKIIELVEDLKELDILYIKAKEELNKRGILKDG